MANDPRLLTLARYLVAAVASGRAKKADWQSWTDRVIESSDSLDDWLIDLSVAGSDEGAEAVLFSATGESPDSDAIIGHLWRRRESREISLSDFLARGARETNGSVVFWYDFDQFALALRSGADDPSISDKIVAKIGAFAEKADTQWWELLPIPP